MEQQIIKKQIMKSKLQDDIGIDFAYKECVVHSQLVNDNIVRLHEYTESEDQFVLFMEYCNDAEYFDNKIVEVSQVIAPFQTQKLVVGHQAAFRKEDHSPAR